MANIAIAQLNYNDIDSYDNVKYVIKEKIDGLVLVLPKIHSSKNCLPSRQEWVEIFTHVFINPLEFFKS